MVLLCLIKSYSIFLLFQTASGKEEVFQLFACIHDANMIERKTADRTIQFEMSIGKWSETQFIHHFYQQF